MLAFGHHVQPNHKTASGKYEFDSCRHDLSLVYYQNKKSVLKDQFGGGGGEPRKSNDM
jgi:hypothetical protein